MLLPGSIRSTRRKPKHPRHNLPSILESKRTNLHTKNEECKRIDTTTNQATDQREPISDTPTNDDKLRSTGAARTGQKTNPWLEEYISKFPCFKQEADPAEEQKSLKKSSEQLKYIGTNHGDGPLKQAQTSVQSISILNKIKNEYSNQKAISNENVFPNMYFVKTEDISNNNMPSKFPDTPNSSLLSHGKELNTTPHIDSDKAIDKTSVSAIVNMLHNLTPNIKSIKTENPIDEEDTKVYEDVTVFDKNEKMSVFFRDPSLDQNNHDLSREALKTNRGPTQGYGHGQGSFTSPRPFQSRDRSKVSIPGKSGMAETGKSAFKCDRCGNAYARMHSLSRHVKFECGVSPKFECYICHKRSKHKHNLLLHMKTHAPQK